MRDWLLGVRISALARPPYISILAHISGFSPIYQHPSTIYQYSRPYISSPSTIYQYSRPYISTRPPYIRILAHISAPVHHISVIPPIYQYTSTIYQHSPPISASSPLYQQQSYCDSLYL